MDDNETPIQHTHFSLCHYGKIYSSRDKRQGRREPLQIEMEMRDGMALAALRNTKHSRLLTWQHWCGDVGLLWQFCHDPGGWYGDTLHDNINMTANGNTDMALKNGTKILMQNPLATLLWGWKETAISAWLYASWKHLQHVGSYDNFDISMKDDVGSYDNTTLHIIPDIDEWERHLLQIGFKFIVNWEGHRGYLNGWPRRRLASK